MAKTWSPSAVRVAARTSRSSGTAAGFSPCTTGGSRRKVGPTLRCIGESAAPAPLARNRALWSSAIGLAVNTATTSFCRMPAKTSWWSGNCSRPWLGSAGRCGSMSSN